MNTRNTANLPVTFADFLHLEPVVTMMSHMLRDFAELGLPFALTPAEFIEAIHRSGPGDNLTPGYLAICDLFDEWGDLLREFHRTFEEKFQADTFLDGEVAS